MMVVAHKCFHASDVRLQKSADICPKPRLVSSLVVHFNAHSCGFESIGDNHM